jgi:putative DNA primase/helicase
MDVSTGEMKDISENYFVTNPIPWKLGENGETPVMDRIFEEWVGKEYVDTLYEIIAYCLMIDYPIHRIFCFIGAGLNGKSCFLNLLRKFIGHENCTSTELDVLLSSRFEVTRLHKKLVCQMGETNFNEMSKTSMLKKLSGNDLIGFEYKNKDPFEGKNYAKILISTNNLPTTTDKTVGFYRRWMIIDFPNQFSEKKDILEDIPEEEYENLAFKSVFILKNLLNKREFHNEGDIEQRMKRYEDHSDPLEKFLKEFTDLNDPEAHIFKWEFEKVLNEWLKENRFRSMSDKTISKKMRDKGVEDGRVTAEWHENDSQIKRQVRAWLGIKWKNA